MGSVFRLQSAGQVVFGAGAASRTGELLARMSVARCLLVTDRNLHDATARVRAGLLDRDIDCTVFDGGAAEPPVDVVDSLLREAAGATFDAVIGLGGGSNIDVAKAAALLLAHGGRIEDYAGQNRVPGPVVPLVAIPTTAGSGSEVSAACILSVPEDNSKLGTVDPHLRPAIAVVDPELHLSCPRGVTRDAGVDAFCHAVEALTIVDHEHFPRDPDDPWPLYQGKHELSDVLAERAIEQIVANLPHVLERPEDLRARSGMALGALLAGVAMSNTGIYTVHALTYPVGSFTHASHGACNGALLPAVLDFVEPVRREESRRILELMGSDRDHVGDAVRDFLGAIGAPASLAELGFPAERIEETATIAHGIRRLMNGSPRPTSLEELVGIVRRAYGAAP